MNARTPLYDIHISSGARMKPFAGFEMPVQYSGIIDEHTTVREHVGVFDVSHMGEVLVTGSNALDYVQHLVTNDVSKLYDGKALYTVMCTPDGGIVDDLLVYRLSSDRYLLVINAANVDSDYDWMLRQNDAGTTIENFSDKIALLAVQGPDAFATVSKIAPGTIDDLKFYEFVEMDSESFFGCEHAILSHTGYTGETGLEIYCDAQSAHVIWQAVMEAGKEFGIKPVGLGARDTLRLESGFCLYGNDITAHTNPLEAGLGWLTKLDTDDFIGKQALISIKASGPSRKLVGFVAEERGIPRQGDEILAPDGTIIGTVTSGTQSPVLHRGIGLGYVPNNPEFTAPGSSLTVLSRSRRFKVSIKRPPFHKER